MGTILCGTPIANDKNFYVFKMFGLFQVAARGIPVAEFNMEKTPTTEKFGYHFEGPCGSTLPAAIGP